MDITVKISRDSVFRKVARRMAWVGTRSPEEKCLEYGRVALSEEDRSLFHSLFDEAAMHAVDLCRPFLSSVSNTDKALTLRLSTAQGAEDSTLALTMESMVTAHVLAEWQEIVCPERAGATLARRDEAAAKAAGILYHHKAPTRNAP